MAAADDELNPCFIDQIGQRLNHPQLVPASQRHLITDDEQRVARLLSFPVSGLVLDVGCSDGAIAKRIAEHWRVDVVGMDVRDTGYRHLWKHDIRLPLPASPLLPFDAIYACEVFEHLTDADAARALGHLMAALKVGGNLIVTVPNRTPHDDYVVQCRDRWRWPDHRSSWTWPKLQAFLAPYFGSDGWFSERVPLYPGESEADSIWLIARAKGKR